MSRYIGREVLFNILNDEEDFLERYNQFKPTKQTPTYQDGFIDLSQLWKFDTPIKYAQNIQSDIAAFQAKYDSDANQLNEILSHADTLKLIWDEHVENRHWLTLDHIHVNINCLSIRFVPHHEDEESEGHDVGWYNLVDLPKHIKTLVLEGQAFSGPIVLPHQLDHLVIIDLMDGIDVVEEEIDPEERILPKTMKSLTVLSDLYRSAFADSNVETLKVFRFAKEEEWFERWPECIKHVTAEIMSPLLYNFLAERSIELDVKVIDWLPKRISRR